jgi:ATP-dependent Clp protease protease subunit
MSLRPFGAIGREYAGFGLEKSTQITHVNASAAVTWRLPVELVNTARTVRGAPEMAEMNQQMLQELVEAVKQIVRKEQSDRLRDVYLIGDIEKDTARIAIERLRELANDSARPITIYINSAGGNVTDGLAIHDAVRYLVAQGIEVTIVVQGMAYSMGSVVLQAASPGRRLAFPHSWIMIHEPAKWAGWQSTTAAAQHLDRLKQMQGQIYQILADRSGKPLRQIIRDTKRNDFYLDAGRAVDYGLIDGVLGPVQAMPAENGEPAAAVATGDGASVDSPDIAAAERPGNVQPG